MLAILSSAVVVHDAFGSARLMGDLLPQMEMDHLVCLQHVLKVQNRGMNGAELAQLRTRLEKVLPAVHKHIIALALTSCSCFCTHAAVRMHAVLV